MDSATPAFRPDAPPSHEMDFASALRAADAIREKQISSVELTRLTFERIERYNPAINAFAYLLKESALAQARKADEAAARGETLGAFHGVPVHVKESFAVAGQPCTWGIPPLKDSKAPRNAAIVGRLLGAGAVLIGATNVPVNLQDVQTHNPIYGTTNNPWDLKRTPGGSSGGSAAALAAGLGYLSAGIDLAGSIRTPSNFCGIYGHRPTLDLVCIQGHQPGGAPTAPGFSTLLATAGPMARSANDLLAALKVLGGPDEADAKAWKWEMPPARRESLKEFRVGYVLDDPMASPASDVAAVLEKTVESLSRSGATIKPGWPSGFEPAALLDNFAFLLFAFTMSLAPPSAQQAQRQRLANSTGPRAAGALASYADWQTENLRRLAFRAQWQAYFNDVDVFLSPAVLTAAFPHDRSAAQEERSVPTPDGPRKYTELMNWMGLAVVTGCPVTVAPVGNTSAGLPVGIQIMGPYWEDATPIMFAGLLAREIGGFVPPPGYSS